MSSKTFYPATIFRYALSFLISLLSVPNFVDACTTVSAVAANGHVWTANNEDGPFGVANFINVFPRSGTDRYGYYTLSYLSPRYGQGGSIQGGMNEAGLSFDFNQIPFVQEFDPDSRAAYPGGNAAILPHILGTMASVEEVIAFFDAYWFVDGFREAQMHVSDKSGRFAIISASGSRLMEKGQPLVSTNFDIAGNADGTSCWRYPIATEQLATKVIGLSTMELICRETAQKNGATMYSNIHNLTTGDIWFFSKHDPEKLIHTNLTAMLAKGQKSYTFNDLESLVTYRPEHRWKTPAPIAFSQSEVQDHLGSYSHSYLGPIQIAPTDEGIEVSFVDGTNEVLYPIAKNRFSHRDFDFCITFETDGVSGRPKISLYENGYWSFSVAKSDVAQQPDDSKK